MTLTRLSLKDFVTLTRQKRLGHITACIMTNDHFNILCSIEGTIVPAQSMINEAQ